MNEVVVRETGIVHNGEALGRDIKIAVIRAPADVFLTQEMFLFEFDSDVETELKLDAFRAGEAVGEPVI